jgi:hypothetical protein
MSLHNPSAILFAPACCYVSFPIQGSSNLRIQISYRSSADFLFTAHKIPPPSPTYSHFLTAPASRLPQSLPVPLGPRHILSFDPQGDAFLIAQAFAAEEVDGAALLYAATTAVAADACFDALARSLELHCSLTDGEAARILDHHPSAKSSSAIIQRAIGLSDQIAPPCLSARASPQNSQKRRASSLGWEERAKAPSKQEQSTDECWRALFPRHNVAE